MFAEPAGAGLQVTIKSDHHSREGLVEETWLHIDYDEEETGLRSKLPPKPSLYINHWQIHNVHGGSSALGLSY